MPKTNLGKWSVVLVPIMFVLFFIGGTLADTLCKSVPASDTFFGDFFNRPALSISMGGGIGGRISALITGLKSIIKQKERSFLVFLSTFVGAFLTYFLTANLLIPS